MRTSSWQASGRLHGGRLAAVALLSVVAACGSSDDDSSDDTTATTESESDSTEPAETSATTAAQTAESSATTAASDTQPAPATTAASDTQPAPATTQADDTAASTGDAPTPGSPIVPASSVDLAAIPPETAIAVIGDEAFVYSVIGPGARKCLAVLDEVLVEGRFVDESGEVMKAGNFDIGIFTLRDGEDDELGLVIGDGISERAWGAGSASIQGIDASGGQIDEIDATDDGVRGSATVADLLSGDGSTVTAEFGVNCG